MSNDSNHDATRTISPSDLQASDFFPPGTGWNKDESSKSEASAREECADEESAVDGARPH